MSRRFFCPNLGQASESQLIGPEAIHLVRVLRARIGDIVSLFDGRGTVATATIQQISDSVVELQIVERTTEALLGPPSMAVAACVPKGDRFQWMVEKLTELGVERVIPLLTQRSVVDPGLGKLDKVRRIIIESSKQCGRDRLLELTEPMRWQTLLDQEFAAYQVGIALPSGEIWNRQSFRSQQPLMIVIGPEGGFTEQEEAQAIAKGAKPVQLGRNILRIETAALAAAALNLVRDE